MQPINKVLRYFIVSLSLAPALCIAALMWMNYKSQKEFKARYDKLIHYRAFIISDLKTIENNPLFPKIPFLSDGIGLVTRFVPVVGDLDSSYETPDDSIQIRGLWQKNKNWYLDRNLTYQFVKDINELKINFSWLEDLEKYDHISLAHLNKNLQNIEHLKGLNIVDRMTTLSTMAYLDFETFQAWAAAYWAYKIGLNDFQQGKKIYIKVRNLIHSASSIEAQEIALAMILMENQLTQNFGYLTSSTISEESIQAYRRVVRFWPQLLLATFMKEGPTGFEDYFDSKYGVCSLAWMGLKSHFMYRDLLQPGSLFEKSYEDHFKRSQKIYSQISDSCGLQEFIVLTEYTPARDHRWPEVQKGLKVQTPWKLMPEMDVHLMFKWFGALPVLRKTLAYNIEKLMGHNGLQVYEQINKQSPSQ